MSVMTFFHARWTPRCAGTCCFVAPCAAKTFTIDLFIHLITKEKSPRKSFIKHKQQQPATQTIHHARREWKDDACTTTDSSPRRKHIDASVGFYALDFVSTQSKSQTTQTATSGCGVARVQSWQDCRHTTAQEVRTSRRLQGCTIHGCGGGI